MTQKNHPARGHRSWFPIADYPYQDYRHRYGASSALTEVTVLDAVPDILEFTHQIEHLAAGTTGPVTDLP